MPAPSALVSIAELAEAPREIFRVQLQMKLSCPGLPCGRSSVTALCAQTGPRLTLLVKSITRRKAVLHTTFGSESDHVHASGAALSHGVGDRPTRLHSHSPS
jgi:hypothetical protein